MGNRKSRRCKLCGSKTRVGHKMCDACEAWEKAGGTPVYTTLGGTSFTQEKGESK